MTIKLPSQYAALQMAEALDSGDQAAIALAWSAFGDSIANQIRKDIAAMSADADRAVLSSRGYRQLTAQESKWYQRFSEAAKAAKTKQAFIDLLGHEDADDIMPETILDDVLRYLVENRPLLSKIRFQNAGYSSKWVINDNTVQRGGWGEIDAEIISEIKGALKVIDITQAKYSCYAIIPLDILDMGPVFIDSFIRSTLAEALGLGLEEGIVSGTGVNMPTGMMKNPNGSYNQSTGYPDKTAIKVTSFDPKGYGELCAKVAVTEKGKQRTFQKVDLVVSMVDYLTKVMPATTVLTANGNGYVRDQFPFPTEVIPCSSVPSGKAILGVLGDYTLAVGGSRNGNIEFDDSVGFLDDTRTFRLVQHAAGRAYDNNSFVVLDISDLDPAYITVVNKGAVTVNGTVTTNGSDPETDTPEI